MGKIVSKGAQGKQRTSEEINEILLEEMVDGGSDMPWPWGPAPDTVPDPDPKDDNYDYDYWCDAGMYRHA